MFDMRFVLYVFIFLSAKNYISSVPIDNGIESIRKSKKTDVVFLRFEYILADPEIKCDPDSISLIFITRKEFRGNVYVHGRFNDSSCKISGSGETKNQISVSYTGTCGVRRRRQSSPMGMAIEATIVVMFHPAVITKVDRAFNVQCFYMQADKTVTASLEVSMLSTASLGYSMKMPNCTYELLQGSPTGPTVRYAQVGDPVYHKWTCSGGDAEMFCITVHSCVVDDGQGQSLQLLDSTGCAQDRYLLQNLEYLSDTMAGREAHVFKFADKPVLYFNCQIRMISKEGYTGCQKLTCPELTKGKRSIKTQMNISESDSVNFDVSAKRLTILDLKEIEPGSVSELESASKDFNDFSSNGSKFENWCFTPVIGIVGAASSALVIFLGGSFFGAAIVVKYKSKKN